MTYRKIQTILSPQERIIFALLRTGEKPIWKLFKSTWPSDAHRVREASLTDEQLRWTQQRVGSVVSRINEKIGYYDLTIKPGRARRSYALFNTQGD
jgi:hypothetical protein